MFSSSTCMIDLFLLYIMEHFKHIQNLENNIMNYLVSVIQHQ